MTYIRHQKCGPGLNWFALPIGTWKGLLRHLGKRTCKTTCICQQCLMCPELILMLASKILQGMYAMHIGSCIRADNVSTLGLTPA